MSRALFLGTLLLAGSFLTTSLAQTQNKTEPSETRPPFPFSRTIFEWDYSCPNGPACSFVCPGGEASRVFKLFLYLGTVSFDDGQNTSAVYYEFSTKEYPHASGFSIGTLSCQVNGMTLDHSGPPK
jgi:hypothetical protein